MTPSQQKHQDRKWLKAFKRELQINKRIREAGIPDLRVPRPGKLPL